MPSSPFSILLPIDGSIYSRNAAQFAWKLAKVNGGAVTAQHVVDTVGASEFLGHDTPGFLPSNPYKVTCEHIIQGLRVMSRILEENYRSAVSKEGVNSTFANDEGDPVVEICKRAEGHDLIVIGHRRQSKDSDMELRQIRRLSIAESLAHRCQRPLLIVQEIPAQWKYMTILLSMDHVNENYIEGCLELAKLFGLSPEIVCLSRGRNEESPENFVKNLRIADIAIKDVPIRVTTLRQLCVSRRDSKIEPVQLDPGFRDWTECLPVVPTHELAGRRLTGLGDSPAHFVRSLAVSTMLFIPEEYVCSGAFATASKKRSSAARLAR